MVGGGGGGRNQRGGGKKLKPKKSEELVEAMTAGSKCKKDGVLEWEKGNVKEALESWRQAHTYYIMLYHSISYYIILYHIIP